MLQRSLQAIGVEPRFEVMPGIHHGEGPGPAMERSGSFFAAPLQRAAATPSIRS